jgi:hypothetical protein
MLAGVMLGALPTQALEHLQEAYLLAYVPSPSAATPRLLVQRRSGDFRVPMRVDLYQGDRRARTGIALTEGGPQTVQLTADETGSYYQVRAALPGGNLAVSNPLWVASDKLTFVLVDASPWANVTVRGGQAATGAQQTPFTAALVPGTYQLQFVNSTLSPPSTLDRTITVPVADKAVHVTMPGFDPARAVDTLLQQGR